MTSSDQLLKQKEYLNEFERTSLPEWEPVCIFTEMNKPESPRYKEVKW